LFLRLLKIRGRSLHPDFRAGDYVLAAGFPFLTSRIKKDDVILFHHRLHGTLVKRVQQVLDGGEAFQVRGTQIDSTDSRDFGPVPRTQVMGKVIWHIRQPKNS